MPRRGANILTPLLFPQISTTLEQKLYFLGIFDYFELHGGGGQILPPPLTFQGWGIFNNYFPRGASCQPLGFYVFLGIFEIQERGPNFDPTPDFLARGASFANIFLRGPLAHPLVSLSQNMSFWGLCWN